MIGRNRITSSCLHKSLRVVNILVNVCGVGMIIYSLWLLFMWKDGLDYLPLSSRLALPRPWFILACLGVGITVCLSTLGGHMVANCINHSVLCIYIVSISSLVLLQTGVIIAIFFKMDLAEQISELIGDNESFKSFIIFHQYMCKLITIMVLVAQVNVIVLAVILWLVGTEPSSQTNLLDRVPDFKHSFLISPDSPDDGNDSDNRHRARRHIEAFLATTRTPIQSYI